MIKRWKNNIFALNLLWLCVYLYMKTVTPNVDNNPNMKSRILSLAIIIAITVISLLRITNGPESIILHWSFAGEADSYGPKYLILAHPAISIIVFLLIINQEKHPYDTSLLSEQSRRKNNPKAIRTIMPILMVVILYLTTCSAQMLPMSSIVLFSLIFLAIIIYIYKSHKQIKH